MKQTVAIAVCIGVLLVLVGCANASGLKEPVKINGEIIYIADLSKDNRIAQEGYILYVCGTVGDLIPIWVNVDTVLSSGDSGMLWQDVLEQKQTGIWFTGTAVPTDAIEDDRLHNLFVAKELTLLASAVESGGDSNG